MEIHHFNAKEPTVEELENLEKLKQIIEIAVADGVIEPHEVEAIKTQAWKDGKITPEELDVYQRLVISKIRAGELVWDFDS